MVKVLGIGDVLFKSGEPDRVMAAGKT